MDVAHTIEDVIENKQPFSLVRLGDGEARLIGYPEYVPRAELDLSLHYWYGALKPNRYQVLQLRAELKAAVANADLVGLPSRAQEAKNVRYKLLNFLVRRYSLLTGNTCHCGIHRTMQEAGQWAALLNGLERVTVITCRDVGDKVANRFNISYVNWIAVPEEAHVREPKERHYPDRHNAIVSALNPLPGEVFLVGAGPNGKVYCDEIKQRGGIGLDLGSVFDGFAGIASRSYIATNPEAYRL